MNLNRHHVIILYEQHRFGYREVQGWRDCAGVLLPRDAAELTNGALGQHEPLMRAEAVVEHEVVAEQRINAVPDAPPGVVGLKPAFDQNLPIGTRHRHPWLAHTPRPVPALAPPAPAGARQTIVLQRRPDPLSLGVKSAGNPAASPAGSSGCEPVLFVLQVGKTPGGGLLFNSEPSLAATSRRGRDRQSSSGFAVRRGHARVPRWRHALRGPWASLLVARGEAAARSRPRSTNRRAAEARRSVPRQSVCGGTAPPAPCSCRRGSMYSTQRRPVPVAGAKSVVPAARCANTDR